jgi:hypothetical protein
MGSDGQRPIPRLKEAQKIYPTEKENELMEQTLRRREMSPRDREVETVVNWTNSYSWKKQSRNLYRIYAVKFHAANKQQILWKCS